VNLKGRHHLEDQHADGRMKLKWIMEKYIFKIKKVKISLLQAMEAHRVPRG
jgi:hypothetical protein